MILIILSWIYILFTTINLGFGFDKIIGLKNKNFILTSVLGLFFITLIASIWSIFGRINIEFHLFLLIVNGLLFLKFKKEIVALYKSFVSDFKQLESVLKFFLIAISVFIIAQCASIPYVIDNESYYIQTIKWINEYGFVKGIVNLHFFLGQTSGWHITQSAFNFSFLYSNFNDLSGFCLLLGNFFAIQKLHEFHANNNKNYLLIGLFPLSNILLFQFISAPSPDIPVYVLSFIIFFYFLENFKKATIELFNLLIVLILFVLYIKNTTVTFTIIPIILLVFNFKVLSRNLAKPFLLASIILALFITKNMIICGSPVFPSKLFGVFTTDYAIPDSIENFYYDQLKYYGYFVDLQQYNSMSAFDLFLRWLSLPKLNGLFNKISILLLLIVPIFIYKFQNKKGIWMLYGIMILQLLLLFATSPQYRFFMNFILFFCIFCLICMVQNRKTINLLLILSLLPTLLILFVPINLNRFSNYKFMMELSNFSIENTIFPYKNTKYNSDFETIKIGNLNYNSPTAIDFFWASGDGELPSVNKQQIDYFQKYFKIVPQMRTNDLKDGFYAKKLSSND
ncbi:LIC_10190 family membrane protein [Flavobacterium sp.]|uniref:LIC_10190 family membrane protein n=1 Tax=Flavobacterium sp. TaxID=239 RepID=UPI0037528C4C